MPNPKPTILEYLVELKKAQIKQDKVKTTILKLLLEKEITRKEILKTLGYTTTRNAPEGMKIQMKLISNRVQSYLRKLWLEDYIDRKGQKYYLKPTLKNQYKALLQLLKNKESNLFLEALKEYVPGGGENASN